MVDRDFSVPVRAREPSVSTVIGGGVQENVKWLVLVGASNLRAVAGHLQAEGFELINLTEPGWVISPENVADLLTKLKNLPKCNNTAYVFDVFGNSCTRVSLFDGTTSLPTRRADGYHLIGKIMVCSEAIFGRLLDAVLPLIEAAGEVPVIILPPQPRYLFSGCCEDSTHCTNLKKEGHGESVLSATLKLRGVLKKRLEKCLSIQYRILDTCGAIVDAPDKSVSTKLAELPGLMAKDGVHWTKEGYKNLASNVVLAVQRLQAGDTSKTDTAASFTVAGTGRHHWRGFTSPVGSKLPCSQHNWQKWAKGRPHQNHGPYPYKGRNAKH
jgi:lysophospholipase L1-like esterase